MNRSEQRELLELMGHKYLYALYNSAPIGRDESPGVYIADGTLRGLCMAFGLYFEVELRRKIRFYKGEWIGEGKLWFSIENEEFSEEDALNRLNYTREENNRINGMRRNMF